MGYGIVDSIRESNSSSFARYQYPSILPLEVEHRMIDIARRAITGIGLHNSPFNIEFFYDQTANQIFLLEINPRISQAHADLFEKIHGHSHHAVMVDLALGRSPSVMEKKGKYNIAGHFMVRTFENGKVIKTPSHEKIQKVKSLFPDTNMKILVQEGDCLSELAAVQDSYSYELANIFIGGRDEADLLDKYKKTLEILSFRIERDEQVVKCFS